MRQSKQHIHRLRITASTHAKNKKWELNFRNLFKFMDPMADFFNFSPLEYCFWEIHIRQEYDHANNSPQEEDDADNFLQRHDHSPYLSPIR